MKIKITAITVGWFIALVIFFNVFFIIHWWLTPILALMIISGWYLESYAQKKKLEAQKKIPK